MGKKDFINSKISASEIVVFRNILRVELKILPVTFIESVPAARSMLSRVIRALWLAYPGMGTMVETIVVVTIVVVVVVVVVEVVVVNLVVVLYLEVVILEL